MVVKSGYGGGEGPLLMGVGWTEATLGILTIALRLYGASKRAGEIKWDFVWIALAGFFGLASHATFTLSIHYGMGNHASALSIDQIVLSLQWIWISIFLGLVGTIAAKWAIIALLLQIHGPNARYRKWFLWALAILCGLAGIAQFVISFTQCKPAAKLWNFMLPGSCPNATFALNFGYVQCSFSALVDAILALYPISIVWNLQASRKMKVGFCFLMAGGIVPAAAATAKTAQLSFLANPTDITYQFAPFMTLAATELWTVIILGSVPPLRPLFVRVFRRVGSTVGLSGDRSRHTYGTRGASRPRTAGQHGGLGGEKGVPLQSVLSGRSEKKGGVNTYTSQVMTGMDNDSEENILGANVGGIDRIVVSTEYAVESRQRDSALGRRPPVRDLEYGYGGNYR